LFLHTAAYIHCYICVYVYIYAGSSPRSKEGSATLDAYLSQKHDKLLAKLLQPDSYRKRSSLAIVDGFAVEITEDQVMSAPLILLENVWVYQN